MHSINLFRILINIALDKSIITEWLYRERCKENWLWETDLWKAIDREKNLPLWKL